MKMRRFIASYVPWVLILFLIVGVGSMVWASMTEPARGDDGCPLGGAGFGPAHNVVVVDASDPLHPGQVKRVLMLIREIVGKASRDERFTLFTIGGDGEPDLLEIMSGCNEANGEFSGDAFKASKAAEFLRDPEKWLEGLSSNERNESPLFEAIDVLMHDHRITSGGEVRLWWVSDFLQNSSATSDYPQHSAFNNPMPDLAVPRTKLESARMLYVQRPGLRHLQTKFHQEKWLAHFGLLSETEPILEKF